MKPLFITLTACLFVYTQAAAAQKPNILLILADDLGAHDVGCFGSTYHQTPNIERSPGAA